MLPLADEEAQRLLAGVAEERRGECWWLVLRDATLIAGDGGGGVALLVELRLTRPVGRLLQTLRLSPIVDTLDRGLTHARKHLGRFVPEGAALRRYP